MDINTMKLGASMNQQSSEQSLSKNKIYKVYIINKLPTPYNDDFFRALSIEKDIDLQVYHLWKGSGRRPWKTELGTGYPNRYMSTLLGFDFHTVQTAWSNKKSLFIVGDWAHFPCILVMLIRIIKNDPVALWVDTPQEHLQRPPIKRTLRYIFLKFLLKNLDVIFGTGKSAKRALLKLGAPKDRIVDLQFIVDLNKPQKVSTKTEVINKSRQLRNSVGCLDSGVVFCMNGTIDFRKKAQDLGLKAFAKSCKLAAIPIGLLVSGHGDELPQLQELAKEMGIIDYVNFLGWQEPEEIDAVYLASDILLHPAHYDPFPVVVLEAMNWGLSVVGSDSCGSVEERVNDGVNGFIFPAGNENAMVESMMKLISDPELLKRSNQEARKTANTWPMSRAVSTIKNQLSQLLV